MFKVQKIKNLFNFNKIKYTFNTQRLVNENKICQAVMVEALTRLLRVMKKVAIVVAIFLAVDMGLELLSYILPFGEYDDADRRFTLATSITFYIVCYIKRKSIKAFFKRKHAALKRNAGL